MIKYSIWEIKGKRNKFEVRKLDTSNGIEAVVKTGTVTECQNYIRENAHERKTMPA